MILFLIIVIFLACSAICFFIATNRGFTLKESIKFSFYGFFLGPVAIWMLLKSASIKDINSAESMVSMKPEHAVLVHFQYNNTTFSSLNELEEQLEEILNDSDIGEYDGNELAIHSNKGILYMYGPDAELLFSTVHPVLEKFDFLDGATATLRFGPPESGVKQKQLILGN